MNCGRCGMRRSSSGGGRATSDPRHEDRGASTSPLILFLGSGAGITIQARVRDGRMEIHGMHLLMDSALDRLASDMDCKAAVGEFPEPIGVATRPPLAGAAKRDRWASVVAERGYSTRSPSTRLRAQTSTPKVRG